VAYDGGVDTEDEPAQNPEKKKKKYTTDVSPLQPRKDRRTLFPSRLSQYLVDLEGETGLRSDVPLEHVVVLVKYFQVTHTEYGRHRPLKGRVFVLEPDTHQITHMLVVAAEGSTRVQY
jgi:hypothetical protein